MKVIKKITAIMLSIMMVLGMCSVVGAAEAGKGETGSITISNAIAGQTYKIYKILTLDSYKPEPSTAGKMKGFILINQHRDGRPSLKSLVKVLSM